MFVQRTKCSDSGQGLNLDHSIHSPVRYSLGYRASLFDSLGRFILFFYLSSRNGIKKVIQLLLQLRSVDKAKLVAAEHNLDDLVRDV